MENLSFVLWMLGYPLAIKITNYLEAKEKALRNDLTAKPPLTPFNFVFIVLMWFGIGYLLFKFN